MVNRSATATGSYQGYSKPEQLIHPIRTPPPFSEDSFYLQSGKGSHTARHGGGRILQFEPRVGSPAL